jgi:hypothetical protein
VTARAGQARPVCALDVDGVVVLEHPEVPVTRTTVSAFGKWRREVLIPDGAPATLRRLAELFDCVWVGAWSHNAHPALRSALHLPAAPWPWIPVQFYKPAAIRAYAGGRPWALIDDGIDDLGPVPTPPTGCSYGSTRTAAWPTSTRTRWPRGSRASSTWTPDHQPLARPVTEGGWPAQ